MISIGDGPQIDPSVRLMHNDDAPITIGRSVKIYRGGELAGPITIGDAVFINRDCYIRPNTTIGDRVNLGPFVRLITDTHDVGPAHRRAGEVRFERIVVGDGVWIGASATILAGVTIGSGAIIAAGAVVASNVAANTVVGGVPARVIRTLTV